MLKFLTILLVVKLGNGILIPFNSSAVVRYSSQVCELSNNVLSSFPAYFDWRDHDGVSEVKDQLRCNACWAFAIVANIESHLRIYRNMKVRLSEQFLLDCDDNQKGCEYGSLVKAFADVVSVFGGILREDDYPKYEGSKQWCRWKPRSSTLLDMFTSRASLVGVVGFKRVPPNEKFMAEAIAKSGPIVAAMNSASMAKYKPNTIDEPSEQECDPKKLNHAVLIVGYNTYVDENNVETPYWIIKNSWGKDWGDHGFYYLVRGRNACGIATDITYGFVI